MSKTQEKDQGIMLFGRKIPLLPESQIPAISRDIMDPKQEKNSSDSMDDNNNNNKKGNSQHNDEATTTVNSNNHVEENVTNEEEEDDHKTMKKPDKIIQCPRCKSMDTKFCYFNNYNVNQPRHFCKNCQRYWTAGGTMRNVPIGAGRRKHKNLASQFRTVLVAAAAAAATGVPEPTNSSSKENNNSNNGSGGTVLKFGHENLSINYCHEYGEESSSSSLMYESSSEHNNNNVNHEASKLLQCYPVVPPWVMPWNNVVPQHHHGPNSIQWCPTPMAAVAATIPVHLVPGPYWGGSPMWGAPIGSNHSRSSPSSSTSNNSSCSGNANNNSPILGKHKRDQSTVFIDEQKQSKCFLVPKIPTRIDESNNNEGSVSPIWATLAMIQDNNALKKIAAKGDQGKESLLHVTEILEANPTPVSHAHACNEFSDDAF
ncbi:hypothetical protein PIB30_096707 [Stylosanthes scabra]|uniref:Dof-type domain-containing protein n=1 Tax=Stylosanthes scabra TaxID=79078 RepID=A0ABU6TVR5_9FABA|nr:hypothetical protein [Stylosanthes scabra]